MSCGSVTTPSVSGSAATLPDDLQLRRQKISRVVLPLLLLSIYGTLGVVRDVTNFLRERELLRFTVGALFGVAAVLAVLVVARTPTLRSFKALGILLGGGGLYAAVIWPMESIEEKVHFLEYGAVALLALECAPHAWRPAFRFGAAALFVLAAGWLDEGIQALLPSRHYDLRDVGFNAVAGVMAISTVSLLRWAAREKAPAPVVFPG